MGEYSIVIAQKGSSGICIGDNWGTCNRNIGYCILFIFCYDIYRTLVIITLCK
jgi:hypothetical protein